jgi:hypothetical protein
MKLAKFLKEPGERKRYSLDYTEWLDTDETIIDVAFVITPPAPPILEVDAWTISASGVEVVFFINFGDDGVTYTLEVQITTSGGQIKHDQVLFVVKES